MDNWKVWSFVTWNLDYSATSAGTSAVMEDLAAMGRCHGMAESVGAVTGGLAAKARCNGILQREQ